jgi:hypothetical protein
MSDTSTPATSGPTSVPRPSSVEVAPLEAISSSGVRASEGSSACSAGRTSVEASPTTAANTKTRTTLPARKATVEAASAPQPTSAFASRNRSRRKRSPSDAANGAASAAGSIRTTPAIPTPIAPPSSYAKIPKATKCAHSAAIAAPHASSTRRRFSLRRTSRSPTRASIARPTPSIESDFGPAGNEGGQIRPVSRA